MFFKTSLDFSAKMYPWHLLKHKNKLKKKHSDVNELATFNVIVNGEWIQSIHVAVAQLLMSVVEELQKSPFNGKINIFANNSPPPKKNRVKGKTFPCTQ